MDSTETELSKLAYKWRTDKGGYHSYVPFYEETFRDRRYLVRKVLEIGIGHPEIMTMTKWQQEGYLPGASIFMWEEYFPNAKIYGLDVRKDTLINEGRIKSFLCNQGNVDSLYEVVQLIGRDFDLIIDDGSHNPIHQFQTANILVPLLAFGGIYVIEDVMRKEDVVPFLAYPYEIKEFNCFGPGSIPDDRLVVIRG